MRLTHVVLAAALLVSASTAFPQSSTVANGPVIDILGMWSGQTGTMEEQRPGSAAAGAASGASNAPTATLKVDSVKMVSTTCP